MTEPNPYAPPTATVADISPPLAKGDEKLNPEGRSCEASHGWTWFRDAWRLFKAQPFSWWAALAIAFGLYVIASIIPLVNLLATLSFPIVTAGIGACARNVLRKGEFRLGDIFDGFRVAPGQLILLGLFYLMSIFGTMLVVGVAIAVAFPAIAGMSSFEEASVPTIVVLATIFFIALAGAVSTVIFSPYLIHEFGVTPVQAMKMSFRACFQNVASSLVAMLVFFGLAILASIPLFLGWFILWPVTTLTVYTAYRDIFVVPAKAD